MANVKASTPKGTRDFNPLVMGRRNFIFDTLKKVFKKYGYQEIQTPSLENLETLTGKYGDEGDQLIFKILNSGDYFSKINKDLSNLNSASLTPKISEKALRYDLTVPFARYVVMHQNEITLPFKRFQIQPVWRADRPQKGRYREFFQCDVDVVGSDSLLNEAEFVAIYDEALSALGLKNFTIKINNRKILAGIAELIGKPELIVDLTVAIDKLDKIGLSGVIAELKNKGFNDGDINLIEPIILLKGSNDEKLSLLSEVLKNTEIGLLGIKEIRTLLTYVGNFNIETAHIEVDITLARGLNYYTGCIFEVKSNEVEMGSIGGGGRYDDLTRMFGLKGLTGVGISFGADRIYDVLDELNVFPANLNQSTQVLICVFGEEEEKYSLKLLQQLRAENISTEIMPFNIKIKKQMQYANDKNIPFTIIVGSTELESQAFTLKNMHTGEQNLFNAEALIKEIKENM